MSAELPDGAGNDSTLQVYLLGALELDVVLRLQRRLHFEISGDRRQAALIVCEHPPSITIGRQGSRAHVRFDPEELAWRRWPIRWLNRGGGCVLHMPGQIALYAILPLDRLGLGVAAHVQTLGGAVGDLIGDFSLHAPVSADERGVWIGTRLVAALGISVRDWVSSYGAFINIHPPLDWYRAVTSVAGHDQPMTSLERERRGRVQPSLVRERLIEHVRNRFGFARLALFTEPPAILDATPRRLLPQRESA